LTKTLTFCWNYLSSICNLSVDWTPRITEDQKGLAKPIESGLAPQPPKNRSLILFLIGLPFLGAGIIFHIGSTCSIIFNLHNILTQVPGIKFKDLSNIIFWSFEQYPIQSLIVYCCKHCRYWKILLLADLFVYFILILRMIMLTFMIMTTQLFF
jgi:hypothetical protein